MAIQTLGKATVFEALAHAVLGMAIIDNANNIIDIKTVGGGDFSFTHSSGGMNLNTAQVFDVPESTVVVYVRLYSTATPTDSTYLLDQGTLPGTTSERTFTYAGTYTLTAYAITAA